MKQDSFTRMMGQIGAEAEAEQRAELKAEQRRALFKKLRRAALLVVLLAIGGVAYANRAQISEQWQAMAPKANDSQAEAGSGPDETAGGKFATDLKALQGFAAERDSLLDDPLRK